MRIYLYFFVLIFFTSVIANDSKKGEELFYQGIEKYKNGDHEGALENFEKACDYGGGEICNLVGLHFEKYHNFDDAADYYKKGCKKDSLFACNNLGMLYDKGRGVWKSRTKAIELYRKSCTDKSLVPCGNLAIVYINGEDIGMDISVVKERVEKDCTNGRLDACLPLALMYDKGRGARLDHSMAAKLYQQALKSRVASDLSKYYLGYLYLNGFGVKKNKNKAKKLYREVDSFLIIYMYKNAESFFAKDYNRLESFFGTLCNDGNSGSCFDLGIISQNDKKIFKAFEYFEKSCKLKDDRGCLKIAKMYLDGDGVKQNKVEAKRIYGELCDRKNEKGCKQYKKLNEPSWWDKIF